MTILDEIAAYAKERVRQAREDIGREEMQELAKDAPAVRGEAFYSAVAGPGLSVICEVKKASPSKGVIDPVFDYISTAEAYEAAGADGISCLTEPRWFLGSDNIFREIRRTVKTPMIRKDFVVDEYQLYQAKLLGASAVLLICSILDEGRLGEYIMLARSLGLTALVEAHDEKEIMTALRCRASVIGVNNRDLKDFSVDTSNSRRLRDIIPEDIVFVSESGIKTPEDVALLRDAGVSAVLIGEALMKSTDKKQKLRELRGLL